MKKWLFVLLFISWNSFAHTLKLFVTLNPAGSFEAVNAKVKGEILKNPDSSYTASQISLRIDDFETGNSLRDEHFKKHLKMADNPKIIFKDIKAINGKGSGLLTLNNLTKEIKFTYKEINPKTIEVEFTTKNSLFTLEKVNYMSIGVEDDIKVTTTINL